MILPAALSYMALIKQADMPAAAPELEGLVGELVAGLGELEEANAAPGLEGLEMAVHARDRQLAAMDRVRDVADKLEKVVPDNLWPLPKYEEMLFIK
jgi:glutamine synthetase